MTAEQLLADLAKSGVTLSPGDKPNTILAAPAGVLTDTQRQLIKAHKAELLALLRTQASAPAPTPTNPDRWAWPHSSAMNGAEIATFNGRGAWFTHRGLAAIDAERLADRLVQRDRGDDDRSLCLECRHLRGTGGGWRCGNARAAGWHADMPGELVQTLQHCPGFADAVLPEDAPPFVAPPTPPSAPAPAPTEPSELDPDYWLVLDKVYQAHHFHCRQCIAAGKGYGKRCDTGLALWIDYERAAMAAPTPATKRKAT